MGPGLQGRAGQALGSRPRPRAVRCGPHTGAGTCARGLGGRRWASRGAFPPDARVCLSWALLGERAAQVQPERRQQRDTAQAHSPPRQRPHPQEHCLPGNGAGPAPMAARPSPGPGWWRLDTPGRHSVGAAHGPLSRAPQQNGGPTRGQAWVPGKRRGPPRPRHRAGARGPAHSLLRRGVVVGHEAEAVQQGGQLLKLPVREHAQLLRPARHTQPLGRSRSLRPAPGRPRGRLRPRAPRPTPPSLRSGTSGYSLEGLGSRCGQGHAPGARRAARFPRAPLGPPLRGRGPLALGSCFALS